MTLPEHAVCSALLGQFGMRQRFGAKGVFLVVVAGIAPDFDVAAKAFGDEFFWKLHHALGHAVLPILLLAALIASVGRFAFGVRPWRYVFGWCAIAAFMHALTDALYWWPIKPLWPFDDWPVQFNLLEYMDLIVLAIWSIAAMRLYFRPAAGRQTAIWTFAIFAAYLGARAMSSTPTGWWKTVTGGWMYELPANLPLIDWW